jgi:peptidoglycan/LPS O-acetylase OafA/YrhL
MVWYIAISGLFLVSLNKRIYHIVAVSVALSLLAQISCASGHHLPMGRLSMLVCCVVGLVCYRREQSEISRQNFVGLLAVLALTIFFNILVGFALFPNVNATTPFRTVIDSWALAAAIFFVPFVTRRTPVWGHAGFSFLGRISYSVYLLHPVVLYLLSLVPLDGIGLVCATFAITITGSVLTYKFVEAPAIRFGHSLKARGPAQAAARSRQGGDAQSRAVSKLRLAED